MRDSVAESSLEPESQLTFSHLPHNSSRLSSHVEARPHQSARASPVVAMSDELLTSSDLNGTVENKTEVESPARSDSRAEFQA